MATDFRKRPFGKMGALACACAFTLTLLVSGCKGDPKSVSGDGSLSLPPAPAPIGNVEQVLEEKSVHKIDFEALSKDNEDIIAWIQVPGTKVDDPVLEGIDNAYYLTHNPKREYYIGGSLFVDMSNRSDFTNPVTVIYGHYMPDETLFTQLHKYKDKAFMEKHPEILVYLPKEKLEYQVVGAFQIGEENILFNRDYTTTNNMEFFLDWLKHPQDSKAVLNTEDATLKDRYIVLSTCLTASDSSGRFVVVGRLAKQSVDVRK